MQEVNLKPCPFCGELPSTWESTKEGEFYVGCKSKVCGVVVYTQSIVDYKERAFARWNTRVTDSNAN